MSFFFIPTSTILIYQ